MTAVKNNGILIEQETIRGATVSNLSEILNKHSKKQKKSSYSSLFPETSLIARKFCSLVTATQAAKISAGSNLEKLIIDSSSFSNTGLKSCRLEHLLEFIDSGDSIDVIGKTLKLFLKEKNVEVDLFRVSKLEKKVYIAELKDSKGEFDTKKADSEYKTINAARNHIQENLPSGWSCACAIVCWNYDGTANFKSEKARSIIFNGNEAEKIFGYVKGDVEQKRDFNRTKNLKVLKEQLEKIKEILEINE